MPSIWKQPKCLAAVFITAIAAVVTASILLTSSRHLESEASGPMVCPTDSVSATSALFTGSLGDVAVQTLSGSPVMLYDLAGKRLTVVITCSYKCPCSDGYSKRLDTLQRTYEPLGVRFLALHSNTDETAEGMKSYRNRKEYPLTVYRDEGAVLADALSAAVTPEAFVFTPDWTLQYHGRIDDDKGGLFVMEKSLQLAIDTLLSGKQLMTKEKRALGCAIVRIPPEK